jgi:hypothetical protein
MDGLIKASVFAGVDLKTDDIMYWDFEMIK